MEKGSTEDVDVYTPRNMLIEVLATASRKIASGQVESGVEAIVPSIEAKRVGDGNGNRNGGVSGTMAVATHHTKISEGERLFLGGKGDRFKLHHVLFEVTISS